MKETISSRISILRALLIFGVVFIHVPPDIEVPSPVYMEPTAFVFIKLLLQDTITRAAVPVLSIISGYLLFSGFARTRYLDLVAKKSQSLLLPLILWNTPMVIFFYFAERAGTSGFRASLYPFDPWNCLDVMLGVTDFPADFPLWFIRDLFVCCLLSPVLWVMLRRLAWPGLIALIVVVALDPKLYVIFRPQIMLSFYVGGLIATRGWQLSFIDRWRWPILTTFATAGLALAWFGCAHLNDQSPLSLEFPRMMGLMRVIGAPAAWALSGLIAESAFAEALAGAADFAFFTFAAHAPLLTIMWRVWERTGSDENSAAYPLFFFAAPFVVVVICYAAYNVLAVIAPSLLIHLSGGRSRLVARRRAAQAAALQ